MSKDAIRAVVVDDEPLARDELSFLLGQLDVEVARTRNRRNSG